jgi:tetratricopeptide (TPR) repeat protein
MELDPNFPATQLVLALYLIQAGEYDDAAVELRRWAEITGNDPDRVGRLAALAERHAASGEIQAVPSDLDVDSVFPPFALPYLYMSFGDREKVLDLFEQAYEERAFAVLSGASSPRYEGLRSEPRFIELLRRIGLE